MCGITGYIGPEESAAILEAGLSNLEYRGYDSAGVALVGDELAVSKQQGTIVGNRVAADAGTTLRGTLEADTHVSNG